MSLVEALRRLVQDLQDLSVPFALVGGLAVSVRTEPRFTRDIDVAIAVDSDPAAEAVVRGLQDRGWTVSMQVEHDALARLAMVRLSRGLDGVVADLLFASSGCEDVVVRAADPLEVVPELEVHVATTGHLIALKLLSRDPDRPTDQADLLHLARAASEDDWQAAEALVELIIQRGAHRGRDLDSHLAQLRGSV